MVVRCENTSKLVFWEYLYGLAHPPERSTATCAGEPSLLAATSRPPHPVRAHRRFETHVGACISFRQASCGAVVPARLRSVDTDICRGTRHYTLRDPSPHLHHDAGARCALRIPPPNQNIARTGGSQPFFTNVAR